MVQKRLHKHSLSKKEQAVSSVACRGSVRDPINEFQEVYGSRAASAAFRQQIASDFSQSGQIQPMIQGKPSFRGLSHSLAPMQAKMVVGEANDRYEQEADRAAAQVVQQIHAPVSNSSAQGSSVQRQQEQDELQKKAIAPIQGKEMSAGGEVSTSLESEINRARGGGQPLVPELQAKMGEAMGSDFSGVRVHTDGPADALNQSVGARAFTTGQDLFFKRGEYQPGSRGGQELIAHELTHVVQQNGGMVQRQVDTATASVNDKQRMEEVRENMKKNFMKRLEDVAKEIDILKGRKPDEVSAIAEDIWKVYVGNVLGERGMSKDGNEVSVNTQVPSQMINGREIRDNSATNPALYPDSKNHNIMKNGGQYLATMSESFNLLTTSLKALARQQFSQNDQYAFWNGTGSKEVALKAPGLALESSHIGFLFDDLGSYVKSDPGDWDPHLWTELSRAYASMVIAEIIKDPKKKINVICGIGFRNENYNIWNTIESKTLLLGQSRSQLTIQELESRTNYYAVAQSKENKKKPDFNQSLDGIKGVYAKAKTPKEIIELQQKQEPIK